MGLINLFDQLTFGVRIDGLGPVGTIVKGIEVEMTDRVKCTNDNCQNMILPATAARTGGLCMPCSQANAREERQRYIEEHRKDIDPFAGVTNPAEIIKLIHQKRKPDPLIRYLPYSGSIESVYAALSELDEAGLIAFAIEEAKSGNLDPIEYICLELAAFKNASLSKLHDFMLDEHIYYPGMLFKNAKAPAISKLVGRLDSESENRNHILLALAWAKNAEVVAVFSTWQEQQPQWASDLYIPPQDYSKEAGWELTTNGKVHQLFLDTCLPLVKPGENNQTQTSGLSTCTPSSEHCQWCNRHLTNLLKIDLTQPGFEFLDVNAKSLPITTCDACACYSDGLFMDLSVDGKVRWSQFNVTPEYLPDDQESWEYMPENCLVLSGQSRAADYAANEFLPTSFSQLGGMPTWIQDSAFPSCPSCNKTMTFVAQISNEDIDDYSEGMYYNFICTDCIITATNYQQT